MATTQAPAQEAPTQQATPKSPGRPVEWSELMITIANGPVVKKTVKTKDVQEEIKKIFTLGVSKDHGAGHRTFGPDKIEYIDDYPVE